MYNEYYEYNEEFPTYFIWTPDEEWQKEVLKNLEESATKTKLKKEEDRKKRLERKQKAHEMREIIQGKLTKEELKYITFKGA